ncbi:uncharacterized protein LOC119492028 [Sebastes umbrosus]|uniref:uncharacterized protein LOC119492028 n=1 Tax=Sebastes umbrosus TaxID=72105 RepID=UPI00189E84FC|nr:uncharacterized protein LOC119492028 [Sebastes umbrosus]
MSRAEKAIISGLQSETEYVVRVRCDCGVDGGSKESITVNVSTIQISFKMYHKSPSVNQLTLAEENMDIFGCRRFNFGKESTMQNRTIMVLGATGSGMSTLINGMINYILGIKWEDSYRFKLVDEGQAKSQAHSQTSEVTVYKINHQDDFKIDHSLTIVDTPGFGNTRGIARDREITEQLRNLFSAEHGISDIDAVCFVAQASLARLTHTQKYVFDSVLSIFGKDVADNIQILVTFADGQQPPVLEAINAADVPCPRTKNGLPIYFKFNNSALLADNKSSAADNMSDEDEGGEFDKMLWDMGTKSMKRFFVALNSIETKSLIMTKEVLRERKQLENSVENLQEQVKVALTKLEELKETTAILKDHEAEITRNEKFELKRNYLKASEAKVTVQAVVVELKAQYQRLEDKVVNLMESSGKCLNRLKEIALKPNPLSTPEYIDMMIEGEKSEAKSGWKQRVDYLIAMKTKAEIMAKVGRREELLPHQESQI